MGEARKVADVAIDTSKEQNMRSFWKHEHTKRKPFCYAEGHLSSQNAELEPKYQKYKGRVVL